MNFDDDPTLRPSPPPATWAFHWALGLALAGVAAFAVDLPLLHHVQSVQLPRVIQKISALAEVFAHGYGVLLIGLVMWRLDPRRGHRLLRLYVCSLGAGAVADGFKLLVARTRPVCCSVEVTSVWQTFQGWIPSLLHPDLAKRNLQSFPSAHTATAVGLAIGLAWLYPRGRWFFAGFAAFAALQRINSSAHFLSDTLFGGAIACVVAGGCLDPRSVGALFEWIESHKYRRAASFDKAPEAFSPKTATTAA